MTDRLKPKAECEGNKDKCSNNKCPLFGTLGKQGRDGKQRVAGCGDPVARGKRNRVKGLKKQSDARKRLGVAPSNKFGDANEENWQDAIFANECKAGNQIQPAVNCWERIEKQVLSNDVAIGSRRKPCRAILMPDGWGKEGLVMIKLSVWEEYVRPAMEEYYSDEEGKI